MKRSIFVIAILSVFAVNSLLAINQQELTDSINNYISKYTYVKDIAVPRIRVKNNTAQVYCSKNLSGIPFTPQIADTLRHIARHYIFPRGNGNVYIFTDGYEISELIPNRFLPAHKKRTPYTLQKSVPLVQNTSLPYHASQGLDGIHLAIYGSHGLFFNQKRQTWMFQRAKLFTTVEDLYTSSYTMPFLVPMLENAGAIVLQPRERDTQCIEVVIDENDTDNVAHTSPWTLHKDGGFGKKENNLPLFEGENPFTMGGYASARMVDNQEDESRFTYYPNVPVKAEYAVYVSYLSLPRSTEKANYIIYHNGQKTSYSVNQRMGGGTWIYLGTFEFSTDKENNRIELSNYGKQGEIVTTDAVKIGGGMGSVARYASPCPAPNIPSSVNRPQKTTNIPYISPTDTTITYVSGMPRYMEGARYWLQYAGVPDSVYNFTHSTNDYTDDYTSRGRWINYLAGGSEVNPDNAGLGIPIHLSLAFHTDAGVRCNDSIIGTLLIYTAFSDKQQTEYPTGVSRLTARDFGDYVQTQIVNDIRASFAPEWNRRMLMNASYSETRNPEVPALILELLSHQNFADMRYGLDPRFRFLVSRAIYKGIVRFIHEQYNTPYCIQPLPIKNFGMHFMCPASDSVCLTWSPTFDSLETTAQPNYYILYTRQDSADWDNGVRINNTHTIIRLQRGHRYDFRIAAANDGGISMPSETLSAHLAEQEKGRVLIINGFTRVCAPESFTIDSTYAGFYHTHGVPYGIDIAYIGEQYEFLRNKEWRSDDDAGFGASYADLSNVLFAGNTFAYPVQHGKVLQELGYTYLSCAASAIDSIPAYFGLVDIIMGLQKETTVGTLKKTTAFRTFSDRLQHAIAHYTHTGGNLLVSGAYISDDLTHTSTATPTDRQFLTEQLHCDYRTQRATKSGVVQFNGKRYQLQMQPDPTILHCENVEGLTPVGKKADAVARYMDSGVCAGISYSGENNKILMFGFPLESIREFPIIYSDCIKKLFNSSTK